MFKDADDFYGRRGEANVDPAEYRRLLRCLTSIALKGDHSDVFARRELPQLTWTKRKHEDDILLGYNAFPSHPRTGSAHIELFAEGHPTYAPVGINAVVGTRDDEGRLTLWIMSTDGESAWMSERHSGAPITAEEFAKLRSDFQDMVV